jgi:hypothetical protein
MKKKILFLSPLPPPNYGSAMSSEECLRILKQSKNFEVRNIKINFASEMKNVGKINLNKIKGIKRLKKEIKFNITKFKPDLIYFMPATAKIGLLREYLLIKQNTYGMIA